VVEQDKFIEDMHSMYCSVGICAKVFDHFEKQTVLTEEVFKTYMQETSREAVVEMVKFIQQRMR